MTVAVLAFGIEPDDIGNVPGMSPGLMSAGLSTVTSTQTFLDISAGNRIFTSLYDGEDPIVVRSQDTVEDWDEIVERADGAPGDIVPGLLGSTLEDAGIPTSADELLITPSLIAVDEQGSIERRKQFTCIETRCPGLSVVPVDPRRAARPGRAPAGRRHADSDGAPAAADPRHARDRDRGPGLRWQPDLGHDPYAGLPAGDRSGADDPGSLRHRDAR